MNNIRCDSSAPIATRGFSLRLSPRNPFLLLAADLGRVGSLVTVGSTGPGFNDGTMGVDSMATIPVGGAWEVCYSFRMLALFKPPPPSPSLPFDISFFIAPDPDSDAVCLTQVSLGIEAQGLGDVSYPVSRCCHIGFTKGDRFGLFYRIDSASTAGSVQVFDSDPSFSAILEGSLP